VEIGWVFKGDDVMAVLFEWVILTREREKRAA
jgi:hypothetical protein